jgi:carbamoyl-phosphate synthase large subunit
MLRGESISSEVLDKADAAPAVERMKSGAIDLVINVPREWDERGRPDGYRIRRAAIDLEIPLITDLAVARKVVRAIRRHNAGSLRIRPWSAYVA